MVVFILISAAKFCYILETSVQVNVHLPAVVELDVWVDVVTSAKKNKAFNVNVLQIALHLTVSVINEEIFKDILFLTHIEYMLHINDISNKVKEIDLPSLQPRTSTRRLPSPVDLSLMDFTFLRW